MSARRSLRQWAAENTSQLVLAPTGLLALVFIYGFIVLTIYLSMSESRILPDYTFVGFEQWERLWGSRRWWNALTNLWVFGSLFIGFAIVIGMALAIFLDQKIRGEGVIRTIYLYPMALSFIVTGTAWKWMLNPDLGLEKTIKGLGWESFEFNWLVQSEFAIYTVVLAAVWQSSGFVMAIFLAALRGIDSSIIQSAMVDGASAFRIYRQIIIPQLRPAIFTAIILLLHMAIKSFDLVIALTNGGPGSSTDLPATFMYAFAFERSRLAIGAAAATMMLFTVVAIIVPYLYVELRAQNRDGRS